MNVIFNTSLFIQKISEKPISPTFNNSHFDSNFTFSISTSHAILFFTASPSLSFTMIANLYTITQARALNITHTHTCKLSQVILQRIIYHIFIHVFIYTYLKSYKYVRVCVCMCLCDTHESHIYTCIDQSTKPTK